MADKIEFGKEEYELLITLKNEADNFEAFREGAEARIEHLEKECQTYRTKVDTLEKIISSMVKKGGWLVGAVFSSIGFIMWLGYNTFAWLTLHSKALDDFFSKIRG